MLRHLFVTLLFFVAAGSCVARADDDCHVSMDQWQPREVVQTLATSRGWTVTRIKIDDSCCEVRGSDETGKVLKAKIDPATLAIVKMKQRDQKDDRHRSKHGEDQQPGAAAGHALPSNPLFEKSSQPKAIL